MQAAGPAETIRPEKIYMHQNMRMFQFGSDIV